MEVIFYSYLYIAVVVVIFLFAMWAEKSKLGNRFVNWLGYRLLKIDLDSIVYEDEEDSEACIN
jgi:hypothetical protein